MAVWRIYALQCYIKTWYIHTYMIRETFIVSSSFSYHYVLEMQTKMGVEVPISRQICEGTHDTGFANATFDNRCIRDIPAELQIYAKNIYAVIKKNLRKSQICYHGN